MSECENSDKYKTITEEEVSMWVFGDFGNNYAISWLHEILIGKYSVEEARDDVLSFRKKEDKELQDEKTTG